jgi:hypothetical protein
MNGDLRLRKAKTLKSNRRSSAAVTLLYGTLVLCFISNVTIAEVCAIVGSYAEAASRS